MFCPKRNFSDVSWSQRVSFAPPNPGDTQSFNRYSYARNNPLSCIDRNGFDDAPADPGTLDPIYVTCCTSSNDGSWNNDPGGAGDNVGGSGGDFRSYLMAGYFSYDFNSSFLQSNYDALYGAAPLQGLPGSQSSDAKSNPATETIGSALPDLVVTASRDAQLSLDTSTSLIGIGLMDDTLRTFFGNQPAQSPKPDCGSGLPNGKTVGDTVRQAIDDTLAPDPTAFSNTENAAQFFGNMLSNTSPHGALDFKNNFKGQGDPSYLAAAGNFAYGSYVTYLAGTAISDFGAQVYGVLSNLLGLKPSTFMAPNGMSQSGAMNVPRGNANAGCHSGP